MKKYLVTYDLNKSDKNYQGVISAIEKYNFLKIMYSAYIIKTSDSADAIFSKIKPYIDSNDRLLVVEINTLNEQGWLAEDAWKWIGN